MSVSEIITLGPRDHTELEWVLGIERECHSTPWSPLHFRDELENPLASIDLLKLGGIAAGFVCSRFLLDELEILNVATALSHRRLGVARTLLENLLEKSLGRGMSRAFLEVRAGNHGAIALYESLGFKIEGRRRAYYCDGEDALLMARQRT